MPDEEIWDVRDLTYSAWHRPKSIARFLDDDLERASKMKMIDLDCVEYDRRRQEPLVFIETARDTGQEQKTAAITRNTARRANRTIPAYTVLYKLSEKDNPKAPGYKDIQEFRLQELHPVETATWVKMKPQEFALFLEKIRDQSFRNLDAKQPQRGWIPVSRGLPSRNIDWFAAWDGKTPPFTRSHSDDRPFTHWMSLPDLPIPDIFV